MFAKNDFILCDAGEGGVGAMIRADFFYPADPATHPFRIETRHSSKTFLAKLNQTLPLNCWTYVKSTYQRLVWMVDAVREREKNVINQQTLNLTHNWKDNGFTYPVLKFL